MSFIRRPLPDGSGHAYNRRGAGGAIGPAYFFPSGLLAVWRFYDPRCSLVPTVISSPDAFNANPPWLPTNLTTPDAHTVRETAVSGGHFLVQTVTSPGGSVPSCSVDVEADGRDWFELQLYDGTIWSYHNWNVASGVAGTQISNCTGTIVDLGAGRFRCTIFPDIAQKFGTGLQIWLFVRNGDNRAAHAGDVNKGLKFYNAQLTQNQLAAVPNLPYLQRRNQALYGDPFDLMQTTPANRPLLHPAGWGNQLAAGEFDAVNDEMISDAVSSALSGTDDPIFSLCAAHCTDATPTNRRLWSFGNSAGGSRQINPYITAAGTYNFTVADDVPLVKTLIGTSATGGARHIIGHRTTGQQGREYLNGVPGAGPSDLNVGTITVDQFTVGSLRRISSEQWWPGYIRELWIGRGQVTDARMIAASKYLAAVNPIG